LCGRVPRLSAVSARLIDRLAAARRRAFVGREEELARFRALLDPAEAGTVVFVHGPGGIGKSTLLRHFGWLAEADGRRVVWLDGRELGNGPESAIAALGSVLGCDGDALERLGEVERAVLVVDNAELPAPMEAWLREELLPRLSADALVVLAGREPPSVAFRADPGWRSVLRTIRLSNLDAGHARELLRLRGVPDPLHDPALAFTHGYPLALALLADVCAQSSSGTAPPADDAVPAAAANPEVLGILLRSLVGSAPSPAHLAALEATSQVLVTTEPLLAALLDVPHARELFAWLRDLSIMDYAPRGLYPHDFVRETLASELRWRHPEAHAAIRTRARAYYHRQFAEADANTQRALLFEFAFLHRDNPVVGPFLLHVNPGSPSSGLTVGRARPDEWPLLSGIVERHEGPESASLARAWFERQPGAVSVVRPADGSVAGLLVTPALDGPLVEDPAVDAALAYLARRRRGAEGAMLVRHWMSAEGYQALSDVQTAITLHLVRLYLATPGLSQVFVTCADPSFWRNAFAYTDFHLLEGAGFRVGGRSYVMFGHDWRAVPPMAWLSMMADRDSGASEVALTDPAPEELTEDEFADAVRAALRDLTRPDRLHAAALGRTRLVAARLPRGATSRERAAAIRDAVREAAAAMESSPRDRKLYRVLHHTFLQPAETQAAAAELLDLPTSTYRRYLAAGVARLAEIMWQRQGDA
jgi:energy-coupling factor transporter ATP-binding protein EcfA2